MRYYNRTNTCDNILENGNICGNKLFPGNALMNKDKNGNWTGKWFCLKCWYHTDYKNRQNEINRRKDINSRCTDRRTGNLDSNCSCAKGDLAEELTSIWKEVKILSNENDNYCGPLDHSPDIKGLVYQTKSKWYDPKNDKWTTTWKNEHYKDFDILIFYCISKDGKIIDRIYLFPKDIVMEMNGISIYKNPSKGFWYEKYRLRKENEINKINKNWEDIWKQRRHL